MDENLAELGTSNSRRNDTPSTSSSSTDEKYFSESNKPVHKESNETVIKTEIKNLTISGSGSGVVGTKNDGASTADHQKTKVYTEIQGDQKVKKGGVGIAGTYIDKSVTIINNYGSSNTTSEINRTEVYTEDMKDVDGNDKIKDYIWNNLPESNKVLVTSANFTEGDARSLPLREVIKCQDVKFEGNSFLILWNRLQESDKAHTLLGTSNNLGELHSWRKPYQEGNEKFQDFIWLNIPDSKKTLIKSNFTAADARNLQLCELNKFQDILFQGNSFHILCDSLKKVEKKVVHFVGIQFNEEMVEMICKTGSHLKIEYCSLSFSRGPEKKINLSKLNLSDENLNQVSVFFKDVECLSLGGNKFSNEAIRKLCDVLKDNDNLKKVAFWSCYIEDEDVQYILPLVDKISEYLELNTNNIREAENYRLLAERQRNSKHRPRIVIHYDRTKIPRGAEQYCMFHYITPMLNVNNTPDWVYLKYEKESKNSFRARQLVAVLSGQRLPT